MYSSDAPEKHIRINVMEENIVVLDKPIVPGNCMSLITVWIELEADEIKE